MTNPAEPTERDRYWLAHEAALAASNQIADLEPLLPQNIDRDAIRPR